MRSYVLVNNKDTYTLVKFSVQDFANDPVLYLMTDYLYGVKENFKSLSTIQVFQNDVSVGLYEIYDGYSDITDCGQMYNEDINQFVDCLAVRLKKTNLAEQVQSLQDMVNPVVDFDTMTDDEIKTYKKQELNDACTEEISKGIQIETDQGTETFSLEQHDQNNISSLCLTAMQNPAITYLPYHSNGNECRMFPSKVIISLYLQMQLKITQETTKCNLLRVQLDSETDRDTIMSYTYDTPLNEDYQSQYNEIITNTLSIIQSLIQGFGGDSDETNKETSTEDITTD